MYLEQGTPHEGREGVRGGGEVVVLVVAAAAAAAEGGQGFRIPVDRVIPTHVSNKSLATIDGRAARQP